MERSLLRGAGAARSGPCPRTPHGARELETNASRSLGKLGTTLLVLLMAGLAVLPSPAAAFCGFYVAGSEQALHNHATTVVLMREGNRTVLSMQNDYAGPPEDFAMVVPVPVVLQRDDVRTLDRAIFERIERLTGPRLVEYWEGDPCERPGEGTIGLGNLGTIGRGAGAGSGSGYGGGSYVRVEAQFAVGEYDVVVLGTNDSSALDTWLRTNRYRIPEGAAEALRPYVEAGMKFFVARVDVERVRFEAGRAVLSPLRVHYDTPELSLPVRLGLLNSSGNQDLVAIVLARRQRFEVANYPNVFVPTNLDVANEVRGDFGAFYDALLDRTFERNPRAVVTEYAWQSNTCDPCPPDATLDAQSLTNLGGDVLYSGGVQPGGAWGFGRRAASSTVQLEAPRVTGQLAPEIIRRVVRRHINEVRFCYEQGLARQPAAAGALETTLTISGSTGAVTESSAAPARGASFDPATLGCTQIALRRWTFPTPADHRDVSVAIRFVLAPPPAPVPTAPGPTTSEDEFVATRLHYRYGRDGLGEDLVFRAAPPVTGGREWRNEAGALEEGATPSQENYFQARYAIRHPWEGPIACESPVRGRWGGPPAGDPASVGLGLGGMAPPVVAAAHAPSAPRASVSLDALLITPVSSLGLVGRRASIVAAVEAAMQVQDPVAIPEGMTREEAEVPATPSAPAAAPAEEGGLCTIGHARARASHASWASLLVLGLALARRARTRGAPVFLTPARARTAGDGLRDTRPPRRSAPPRGVRGGTASASARRP